MIRVSVAAGRTRLAGEIPPGTAAYLDAEWVVPDASVALPVIEVGAMEVRWRGHSAALAAGIDADAAAAAVLDALARRAASAVRHTPAGDIEILGKGYVARRVREALGATGPRQGRSAPPNAYVDTTGDPASIRAAMARVADLGTLVLAGEGVGRPLDVDLYRDVHVRGLTVVGVDVSPADGNGSPIGERATAAPASVALSAVLPDALWYRVTT